MDVVDFIKENIVVCSFPRRRDIGEGGKYHECRVIINVSDEFFLGDIDENAELKKISLYFPMGESGDDMGLKSIYGALHTLHQIYTWNPEWKVLIHCQAGRNRSPTIREAFYFMMTGEHEPDNPELEVKTYNKSRLLYNCENEFLPSRDKTELFLTKCKEAFDNSHKFFGGMLDWVMLESGNSSK